MFIKEKYTSCYFVIHHRFFTPIILSKCLSKNGRPTEHNQQQGRTFLKQLVAITRFIVMYLAVYQYTVTLRTDTKCENGKNKLR